MLGLTLALVSRHSSEECPTVSQGHAVATSASPRAPEAVPVPAPGERNPRSHVPAPRPVSNSHAICPFSSPFTSGGAGPARALRGWR